MRAQLLLVVTVFVLCISACTAGTSYPGLLQGFPSACDKSNEGQQIAVEGYLRLPDTLTDPRQVVLRLYPDMSFTAKPIGVNMKFGNGNDEAQKITSSFRDTDLKIRLADGKLAPFGTKVRVSGRMYYPLSPQDFNCALENPYVEAAK